MNTDINPCYSVLCRDKQTPTLTKKLIINPRTLKGIQLMMFEKGNQDTSC